jgi:hypothetical protein
MRLKLSERPAGNGIFLGKLVSRTAFLDQRGKLGHCPSPSDNLTPHLQKDVSRATVKKRAWSITARDFNKRCFQIPAEVNIHKLGAGAVWVASRCRALLHSAHVAVEIIRISGVFAWLSGLLICGLKVRCAAFHTRALAVVPEEVPSHRDYDVQARLTSSSSFRCKERTQGL